MKTLHRLTSALVATGSAVVAFLTLVSFIPADLGLASLVALGVAAFALFDYSRPTKSLTVPAQILRPILPSASASPIAYPARRAA